jgi:hypothetical protein
VPGVAARPHPASASAATTRMPARTGCRFT